MLKVSWLLIVVFFLAYYVFKNGSEFVEAFQIISIEKVIIALFLLALSKLFLTLNQWAVFRIHNVKLGFKRATEIYNYSQLAKYIPGGIWHYVSKGAYLKAEGKSNKESVRIILTESLLIVITAFLFGVLALGKFAGEVLVALERGHMIVLGISVVTVVFLFLFFGRRYIKDLLSEFIKKPGLASLAILNLGIVWVLQGLSLYVLLETSIYSTFMYVMGIYCVAFAIGFLTVFAPGGIGVREAILYYGFSKAALMPVLVPMLILHRILYLFSEILVGGVVFVCQKLRVI